MPKKSRMFRVATEGATTDGRRIERQWIEQMARNFDPAKYGARVWLEHIRGIYPDSDFRAYGDVTALESRPDDDGKLALFAQITPLPDLVEMTTRNKQKIYTSIEVNPKFADTGEAYLVGLAVTDSPASLGTDVLSFAAQHPAANPFASRKTTPECLFSEAVAVTLEFDDIDDDTLPDDSGLLATIKHWRDAFSRRFDSRARRQDETATELMGAVQDLGAAVQTAAEQHARTARTVAELHGSLTALQAGHKTLQDQFNTIDTTDAGHHAQRPAATGAAPDARLTDC